MFFRHALAHRSIFKILSMLYFLPSSQVKNIGTSFPSFRNSATTSNLNVRLLHRKVCYLLSWLNRRIRNRTYGGVRGRNFSFKRNSSYSITLKRDDALTLALTAAYKEGAAHDTTWPPTNSDDVLATVKKIQTAKWGQSNCGCEKRPEATYTSDFQS